MNALSCAALRELDRLAIEELGLPSAVLMENAGRGAAEIVLARIARHPLERGGVVVLCGAGNNGGDGAVVARHLANAGVPVELAYACAATKLRGDAALQRAIVERMGLTILEEPADDVLEAALSRHVLFVDALLGTGSHGAPRRPIERWIRALNAARERGGWTLALDLPSGLDADSGTAGDPTIRADHTATFAARKLGFESARAFTGPVDVVSIGTPPWLAERARARTS